MCAERDIKIPMGGCTLAFYRFDTDGLYIFGLITICSYPRIKSILWSYSHRLDPWGASIGGLVHQGASGNSISGTCCNLGMTICIHKLEG